MKPTTSVLGAIRLRLTTKKANKDYYKGTRQAFVPGTNVRTGRPGAFSKSGSEFRVDDNKVRYYVAPPMGLLDKTDLKPYVEKSAISDKTPQKTAPFQPHAKYSISTEEYRAMKFNSPEQKAAYRLRKREHLEFAAKYRALSADQREALKMQARREWWESFNL